MIINLQLVYRYILSFSKTENMFDEKKKKEKETNVSNSESRTHDHRRVK